MLTPENFFPSQVGGIAHLLQNPQAMLWNRMGKGKTIQAMTAAQTLMNQFMSYGFLVIAPLRVCQTVWEKEARKWEHTRHLTFSLCHNPSKKQRHQAIRRRSNFYLINWDGLGWFVDEMIHIYLNQGLYLPFNGIIYDEITMGKNATSKRSKAIRRILPWIEYRWGLTGTPSPNGLKDLYGQYLLVDDGQRLGRTKKSFEEEFANKSGQYNEIITIGKQSAEEIKYRIADITYMVPDDIDGEDLPPFIFNPIEIQLPPKAAEMYAKLESEMFIEFDSGIAIETNNTASLYNKCLQAANGALYYEKLSRDFEILHDAKLDALAEIIESTASPVLVMYSFIHDFERIKKRFPKAEYFHSRMKEDEAVALEERWNRGEIELLVGHPKSLGHGLNLQFGGFTIVWYGLNWSLELFRQAIYRLRREGQENNVWVHMLMCLNTLDYAVYAALNRKAETEDDLRDTINDYRQGRIELNPFDNEWAA